MNRQYNIISVQFLLEHGADINAKDGLTPLYDAFECADFDLIRFLVEKHCTDVNTKDDIRDTPLHYACQCCLLDLIKILIDLGADVNAKRNNGWTPLHDVCRSFHLDNAEYLVDHGADVNAKTKDGRTPLQITEDQDIRNYLISKAAK